MEGFSRQSQRWLAHRWADRSQRLMARGRLLEAEAAISQSLAVCPDVASFWVALASVRSRLMRPEAALAAYQTAERLDPELPLLHLSIGHVFKTLGRRSDCERTYRECIASDPTSGEAYWSLADLKTYRFSDTEIRAMEGAVSSGAGGAVNLSRLHFALGRAWEQRGNADQAFSHYATANNLRYPDSPFDSAAFESKCRRVARNFDAEFFARIRGHGCPDSDPIFIVGLPRSGSTLVEQILASHSRIEGTMELPNVPMYISEFERSSRTGDAYPESTCKAPVDIFRWLGKRYLEETQALRRGRQRFIDKLPNNFLHIGLIHAMLPNATIIDVRRNPMDSCFSCYKQNFAAGQRFTYALQTLGQYYRRYLELMDHWDRVLPGLVLHVSYEELIRAPEPTVRRMLDHCGVPFDAGCLDFHRNDRAVRTASSEQVRQPLYDSGIGQYRAFEQHLRPLRAALGDCLGRFPEDLVDEGLPRRNSGPIATRIRVNGAARVTIAAAVAGSLAVQSVAADPAAGVLQEIVVTARKRSELLQDVPQNIDVLTARDVADLDVVKIEDFATFAPSISLISSGPGGQRLFIRGASDGSNSNYGFSKASTTGFMVDDLSFAFYGHDPDLHLYDIERIEILNGPQGTLFGPGALSGTVRVITKKPDPGAFAAGVDVEGSQIDHGANNGSYQAYLNVPLIEGTTALRMSAYRVSEGGYIDNVLASRTWLNGVVSTNAEWAGRNLNTRDILGGRLALQHAFADTWLVRLTGYYQQQVYRGSWDEDPVNVGNRELRRFSPQGGYNYGRYLELHFEGGTPIGDFVYAGGYSRQNNQRLYDFSDYAQYSSYSHYINAATCASDPTYGNGYRGCKAPYMFGDVTGEIERYSNELRLQSKSGGRLHWIVGAYWEKTLDPYDGFEHLPNIDFSGAFARHFITIYGNHATPLPEEFYSGYASYRNEQWSEFGDVSIDLNSRWSVEAGVQHFHSASSQHQYWAGLFFIPKTPSDGSLQSDKTNFKAGLNLKLDPDTLLYFAFAQGFRDGDFNTVPANPKQFIPAYGRPDTLDNFEIGAKVQRLGGRLTWNTAFYYMPWKDYQVTVSIPSFPYSFDANVGNVRIWGGESSIAWQPLQGLEVRWTGNLNESTLLTDEFESPHFQAVPGERVAEAPTFNWSASVRYEHGMGSAWRAFGQLDCSHKGGMWNSLQIDGRTFQPPYTLGNLRGGIDRANGSVQLEAFVTNLWNTRGVVFYNSTGYDYFPGISTPEIVTPPRTFGLRLHYGWGKDR